MKILIQHTRNKLFFRRTNVWTDNISAAFDFEHTQKAIEFAFKHNIADAQLFIDFHDPASNVTVPLPESRPKDLEEVAPAA
jgi:hypothetical protein